MATTTYTTSNSGQMSTDAEFRLYGGGLSTALAAIGFVKTADTGQINWTTVLKPASATTQQGYEIWRFNDTLQATAPLFVRIGYGSGVAASIFGLWFTIGKGTDGAGVITGTVMPQTQVAYSGGSATTTTHYLSSGDGSAMVLLLSAAQPSGATSLIIVIERSRSAIGAPTGTGLMFLQKSTSTATPTVTGYNYTTGTSQVHLGWPVATPINAGMAFGSKAPVFPGVISDASGNLWQPRALVSGAATDLGSVVAITVPGWGTYLPVADKYFGPTSAFTNISAAFVWA